MSDMNIDSQSSTETGSVQSNYSDNTQFKSFSSVNQDTLVRAYTTDELNIRFSTTAPELPGPDFGLDSIRYFFGIVNNAKVDLSQQLDSSAFVDQATRIKQSRGAAIQAAGIGRLIANRPVFVEEQRQEADQAKAQLKQIGLQSPALHDSQQQQIDNIRTAISAYNQQTAHQQIKAAQASYIQAIKNIGVIDNGDGTYNVPQSAIGQYNSLTANYQAQLNEYNSNFAQYVNQINTYNAITTAYNTQAGNDNALITKLLTQYHLQSDIDAGTVPNILLRDTAATVDTSHYGDGTGLSAPPQILTSGTISVPGFPPYVDYLATHSPPVVNQISDYTAFDGDIYNDIIETRVYSEPIQRYDGTIIDNSSYWSFLNGLEIFKPLRDSTPDPLLNDKKIAGKLLPIANNPSAQPLVSGSSLGAGTLSAQTIGLGNPHIEGLLGKAIFLKALTNFNLNLSQEQLQEATNQLLILEVGLLGSNGISSAIAGIGPFGASLPSDSPTLSLLFSLSLAKRVAEAAGQGLTQAAVEELTKNFPLFANLTDEQKETLTAILNLSQSLVATKLIEDNLGLTGLSSQVLSLSGSPVANQATTESQQETTDLTTTVQNNFSSQGFSPEESTFLGQTTGQLVDRGLNTPSPPIITAQTIDRDILVNSLKASILLFDQKRFNLIQLDQLVNEVVTQALQNKFYSTSSFRTSLINNLQEAGLNENAPEIALEAVVIPKPEIDLTKNPLKKSELIALLNQRITELLVPQLGAQLSKQVTQEIATTLFGTPNPDASDIGDVKRPTSIINVVKDQVRDLHIEQNQEYAVALNDTFKDTIKTSQDFYAFSRKLMDPAYLYVYSSNDGIMYAGNRSSNWKHSIDIIV